MTEPRTGGTAVLVFARSPRPGEVKTRLIPALNARQAAALHARMVAHALSQAHASRLGPVILCCAPDSDCPQLSALARRHGAALQSQQGRGLGERMAHALDRALEHHHRVLLMGSDCPWLDAAVLRDADTALARGATVVLVPAVDGGYVLVGARQPCKAMFDDVPWGTAGVLKATRLRLTAAGLSWVELPPLRDIDRPQDLDLLPPEFLQGPFAPKF